METVVQLVVEIITMKMSWLSNYDGGDGVGCAQSHSYAEMNVHKDGVESHRSDLILLVG